MGITVHHKVFLIQKPLLKGIVQFIIKYWCPQENKIHYKGTPPQSSKIHISEIKKTKQNQIQDRSRGKISQTLEFITLSGRNQLKALKRYLLGNCLVKVCQREENECLISYDRYMRTIVNSFTVYKTLNKKNHNQNITSDIHSTL